MTRNTENLPKTINTAWMKPRFFAFLLDHLLLFLLFWLVSLFSSKVLWYWFVNLGYWLYFVICTFVLGGTPGKRVLSLRVISISERGQAHFWQIFVRETVGRFLGYFFFPVGHLSVFFKDSKARTLPDWMSKTRVVREH